MPIQAASITASCSAQVRTWPVSVTVPPLVSAVTLQGQQQQGVVASADPGALVAGAEHRLALA